MEHEEESVVGDHEEDDGGGGDTVDDGWDENGDPYQPFIAPWHRPVIVCTAGGSYTTEEAEEIVESVCERNDVLKNRMD
ncbi:unnamed protein product [Urochloa humidicola]